MVRYIFKRFLGIIPTLFVIVTLNFVIVRTAPGGPFSTERAIPEQVLKNIEAKYHLDEPLIKQYARYIWDIVSKGDLGPSFRYKDHNVNFYIFQSLPNSLILGGVTMILALILGITFGILAAYNQNTWIDYLTMFLAVVGISVPNFVIGPMLQYFLALKWNLLPSSGWIFGRYGLNLETLIMPVITLSFAYLATISRLSRASVLEVLRSDYVRTAKAKGLRNSTIVFKHVLKGGILPVVSYLGPAFSAIITGSVVVESIFRVPGLGKFFVQSALNRDYTLILGVMLVYSTILIIMNFLVDILYSFLDPRVNYS